MAKPQKKPISFEKPKKTEEKPVVAPAPELKKAETPAKPKAITKVPKVVEIIESEQPIVSVSAKKESIYEGLEMSERIQKFNRFAVGTPWKSRQPLEALAQEFLGEKVISLTGLNPYEVAFEIEGIRVPDQGFYMIRP